MIIIFNLIILGLVALIAYWWANEGLFSSLLHLVCVIAAGAIALSLWEPITMAILKGSGFDNYAWGAVLVGVFVVFLLILRVISDKVVRANITFPSWANLTFGGIAGICSGILSVGICLIGSGFVQSSNNIMEYRGIGRDENARGAQVGHVGDPIWVDIPKLTANFFSILSVGTLHPDISESPLQQFNPRIDELSYLVRDSFDGGKGQLSLAPDAAKATKVAQSEDGLVVIQVLFNSNAKDFGGQLSISSSQVRLIGEARGSNPPELFYPISWKQEVKDKGEILFRFDKVSHYATSVPGQQNSAIKFAFETNRSFKPRFIQIRGTRLPLPPEAPTPLTTVATKQYRGVKLTDEEVLAARDPLGKDIQHLFDVTSKIRGLRISTNGPMDNIEYDEEDNTLIEGTLNTQWTHQGVSSALAIKGIKSDKGTAIVQLPVDADKSAAFQDLHGVVAPNSPVVLIDSQGRKYPPIGFIVGDPKRMQLTLSPSNPIISIDELPMNVLTSSNPKRLNLIFQITEGEWIKEFRVGEYTIGTCNIQAVRNKR